MTIKDDETRFDNGHQLTEDEKNFILRCEVPHGIGPDEEERMRAVLDLGEGGVIQPWPCTVATLKAIAACGIILPLKSSVFGYLITEVVK